MKERAIVICGDDWNPGVIGLAASRLVEKYKWPTVLLSYNGENCVGSARSIPGVNIHEAMNTCCDLFIRFGGHAQAAGLTISKENVPEFRKRLSKAINSQIKDSPETFIPTEEFDLELELSEITEELVKGFDRMQPTGFGNAAPVFCLRGVHTTEIRTIGKESAHLRMKLAQGNELRSAIGFRMGDKLNSMPEVIDAIVGLSINEWQGKRTVQCELKQVQPYMPGKAFIEECKRQVNRFDYAMLDAMELEGTETSNIEKMPLVQAEALLKEAFHESYQGVLIGVHTLAAMKLLNVHLAVMHAQLDYVIGETADIRGFNTLVIAPKWEKIAFKPRIIVALDGFLSDGERMAAKKYFPNARIIEVTDMRSQASSAAERLLPTDDELRNLYRELRRRARTDCTLNVLTEASGLNEEGKTIAGLKILNELHLIEYTLKPLSWKILPSGKVLLENSKFRARMIQMKNEGRKLI